MHIAKKTQPPQGYCDRTLHPIAQAHGRNAASDLGDTDAMSFVKPLAVGVRVRIKQASIELANDYGTVTRLDARGARVKLDSGREFLVEPATLEVQRGICGHIRELPGIYGVVPSLASAFADW